MFSDTFLFQQNEFLIVTIVLALLLIATEIGFRRGRAAAPKHESTSKSQHSTLQTATMGLLALLLAFTFSMSAARFETRKQLIVEEANAIDTAYLRGRLLPESDQGPVTRLFRSYVDARLQSYGAGLSEAELDDMTDKVHDLQRQLWSQAVDAANKDSRSIPIGLFVPALNYVIDVAARRDVARDNHVPESVLFLLFLMAILTIGLLGFGCGLVGQRDLLSTTAVCLLLSLVILIILDLDRPRRGLITISQKSLIQLRDYMR